MRSLVLYRELVVAINRLAPSDLTQWVRFVEGTARMSLRCWPPRPGHRRAGNRMGLSHDLWSRQGRVRCVCHADRRIAAIAPSVETPRERTDPFDATASQDQRHPGAGGLVGSGAVEDDVP